MPRLSDTLLKAGGARNPNVNYKKFMNYHVKSFANNKIRELNLLGNRVSIKNPPSESGECREDMLVLMNCWKKNGFAENVCVEEHRKFMNCNNAVRAKILQTQKTGDTSQLGVKSDDGKVNPHQANKLLRMYPQPPHNVTLTHSYGKELGKPFVFKAKEQEVHDKTSHNRIFTHVMKKNRR